MAKVETTETRRTYTANGGTPRTETERVVTVASNHGATLANLRDFIQTADDAGIPPTETVTVTRTPTGLATDFTVEWRRYLDESEPAQGVTLSPPTRRDDIPT